MFAFFAHNTIIQDISIVKKMLQNEDIKNDMKKHIYQLNKYNKIKDIDDIEYMRNHLHIIPKTIELLSNNIQQHDIQTQTEYEYHHQYCQTDFEDDYVDLLV